MLKPVRGARVLVDSDTGEVFVDAGSGMCKQLGGGASSWNDIKGKPFFIDDNYSFLVNHDASVSNEVVLSGFPVFNIGDLVTVFVDNERFDLTAFDDDGWTVIGSTADEINNNPDAWQIYTYGEGVWFWSETPHIIDYNGCYLRTIYPLYVPHEFGYDLIIRHYWETGEVKLVHGYGSYWNIFDKINNGELPNVLVYICKRNNDGFINRIEKAFVTEVQNDWTDGRIDFTINGNGGEKYFLYEDNTVEHWVYED